MVIISLELTRVSPDRNIFSINVELTFTYFTLQRFGPSPSPNFKWITKSLIQLPSKTFFKLIQKINVFIVSHVNEGGVAAGLGALDSVYLVDASRCCLN